MSEHEINLEIMDGPDKPGLIWALTYPEKEQVHFKLADGGIDGRVTRIDEMADGFTFQIEGVVISGAFKDKAFSATYSVGERTGSLDIARTGPG